MRRRLAYNNIHAKRISSKLSSKRKPIKPRRARYKLSAAAAPSPHIHRPAILHRQDIFFAYVYHICTYKYLLKHTQTHTSMTAIEIYRVR